MMAFHTFGLVPLYLLVQSMFKHIIYIYIKIFILCVCLRVVMKHPAYGQEARL